MILAAALLEVPQTRGGSVVPPDSGSTVSGQQSAATPDANSAGNATAPAEIVLEASCRVCHADPARTARCPRTASAARLESASHRGPSIILLDMLKDQEDGEDYFGPVPFNHAAHTGMAGSCTVCHHHTPEGQPHPECRSCHDQHLVREDIRKPSLKGAYHRQCMGCHREWAHEDRCQTCHLPKGGVGDRLSQTSPPVYMAEKHPVVEQPQVHVYQTEHEPGVQSKVVFNHRDHIDRYGNNCVDCHQRDNCTRCHQANGHQAAASAPLSATTPSLLSAGPHGQAVAAGGTRPAGGHGLSAASDVTHAERHRACSACHLVDNRNACVQCHWQEGQPTPQRFDHALTGWPLMPYHQDLRCRDCHKRVPFAQLDPSCGSCHAVPLLAENSPDRHLNCIGCHNPHDAWYGYVRDRAAADLCVICHRDTTGRPPRTNLTSALGERRSGESGSLNVATTRPFDMSGHPIGKFDFTLPSELAQAGAKTAEPGSLDCLVCHSTLTSRFEPITLPDAGPDGLCLACHAEKKHIFGTLHDIRSESPAGGTCRTCHPVHGPAREAISSPADPDGRCTVCHQAHGWGQAKTPSVFPHPQTDCSECHDPHESRYGSFLIKPATQLCTDCHAEQGRLSGGPHDPKRNPDVWPDPAAARRGECLACHVPHNNQAATLLRIAPDPAAASPDAACLACHPHAAWNSESSIAVLHPRQIAPDQDKVDPARVPADEQGRQRMACSTCHDAHGGAQPGYLTRGDPDEPAGLCLQCHEQKKYIRHTGHSTESLLALGLDAAACRPCHAMHARRDSAWGQMLSPRFLEEVAGGRQYLPGDGAFCLACHHADGPAPMPEVAAHPTVSIHNTVSPDAPGYLPLFDDKGNVSPDGHITCRTCHLSHGRLDLLELAERDHSLSEQDRRAMRLNLRSFVAPNICTQCHGGEARLRFLIFHDAEQRRKLPPVATQGN